MKNQSIYLILLITNLLTGCTLSAIDVEHAISKRGSTNPTNLVTPIQTQRVPIQSLNDEEPLEEISQTVDPADHQRVLLSNCSIQYPTWPTYIISPGDNLTRIASQFDTSVAVLTQVNCLVDANQVYVGQRIHVPPISPTLNPAEPSPNLPLIDMGPLSTHVCAVVPSGEQTYIWDIVSGHPIAILIGTAAYVSQTDTAYIVETPLNSTDGVISKLEARLVGSTCAEHSDHGSGANPNMPSNLPVIINGGGLPSNLCIVVKEASPGTRYVYGGPSSAHAPIAIMGDYLLVLAEISDGYSVVLPGWDMNGWIPKDGVTLMGNNC